MFTNINILGRKDKYNYIVEYIPTNTIYSMETNNNMHNYAYKYLLPDDLSKDDINTNFDDIVLVGEGDCFLKHYNEWFFIDEHYTKKSTYLPSTYKQSIIRLYFPQHSMESYDFNGKYALTISTWIAGRPIILSSTIISRMDALACDNDKIFMNQQYLEYIDIKIIDPTNLLYDDEWIDFRHNICKESELDEGLYLNNTGSLLYITLDPVVQSNDKYIKSNDFYGGQGSINYSNNNNNLRLNLTHNCYSSYNDQQPAFNCGLSFNEVYKEDFNLYLQETYLFGVDEEYSIEYTLVIGNETNLYSFKTSEPTDSITYSFSISELVEDNFKNWNGYVEGIYVSCSAEIYKDGESIINLVSNKIPLTKELYKFFVKDSGFGDLHYIELNDINMNIHNIQAFNKIETTVIQSQTTSDSKSNIIQPVFYRAVEASDILIHKEVTEMICINLDNYKSKVNSFIIQIEGLQFPEYGRTAAGVLFKIIGNKLPGEITKGNYYILNQDSEMVTTGKYIYN